MTLAIVISSYTGEYASRSPGPLWPRPADDTGTDWADPGKAVLSEMLPLEDLGIPMAEVFRIATLDGARAIGVGDEVGAVEPGMRAHLVLFESDPRWPIRGRSSAARR